MKTAVILFNLGGPDKLSSIKPFLKNLFLDPAIISLPSALRIPLASFISSRREKEARSIYTYLGGKSPLLENTQKQAQALETELGQDFKTFICMRYWHPMTEEVIRQVKAYAPDEVILLPLYPQFSTTTTGSSFKAWVQGCKKQAFFVYTREINDYCRHSGFINALAELTEEALRKVENLKNTRVLFTAHGLPKKTIQKGDPYKNQVEETVSAVLRKLSYPDLDYNICYQSRVGPLEWIKPYTDEEIKKAGKEGKSIVVVPVAFVSEHSETLVELDIEYKKLAAQSGVPVYDRVPTIGTHPSFIKGLKELVVQAVDPKNGCRFIGVSEKL